MSTKKELFNLAKCLEEEHRLQKRIRELREKRDSMSKWEFSEWSTNAVVLGGSLPEVLAINPEVKPTWYQYTNEQDGSERGFFTYGPVYLGEIRKGFHAWLKHQTQSVEVKPATKTAEATPEPEAEKAA